MGGRLKSKVAIVTGAVQGIGRAIAEGYVREGARVAIADIQVERARAVAGEINASHPGAAIAIEADVASKASVDAMVTRVMADFGRIDILVANAALWKELQRRAFFEVPVEEWDRVFAVNARGPFLCAAAVTPVMQRQGKGKIILVGSSTIWTAQSSLTAYVASKAALIGLLRCAARELGPHNITVNMIHPGITDTGGQPREYLEARSKQVRLIPRVQAAEDLVGTALFLASDESDAMTGQQLHVDGGTVLV